MRPDIYGAPCTFLFSEAARKVMYMHFFIDITSYAINSKSCLYGFCTRQVNEGKAVLN